jgi:hypothetical protein
MALGDDSFKRDAQTSDIDVRDPDEVSDYIAEQGWRTFNGGE